MRSPENSTSFNIAVSQSRYQALIGVGGIGAGSFFALNGNHTLGREESRGGHFLDRRDYCKLHIITHYTKALLGPEFAVIPLGRVGDDEVGRRLCQEMAEVGLAMDHVAVAPGEQTLFSFCFIYPDGSGGNLTTDDSACARVDPTFVARAEAGFARFAGHGVALAAPEVPLPAREQLLQLGSRYNFFRIASFLAEEMAVVIEKGLLRSVDLLAINLDEAAAAAGSAVAGVSPDGVIAAALDTFRQANPAIQVSITAGKNGSWSWDGAGLVHVPAFPVKLVSTAGAGDAHLAGIIAGLVAGLALPRAQELGTLVAAQAVTSPHTIAKEVNGLTLPAFAREIQAPLSNAVQKLLGVNPEK